MILAFGTLLLLTIIPIPLFCKHFTRLNCHSVPVLHEISSSAITKSIRCNKPSSANDFDSLPFNNGPLERSHLHRNNLRLYSVFEWAAKFEEEERLLKQARTCLRQARKELVRKTMGKTALVFQASKPLCKPWLTLLIDKNENFLQIQRRHSFAYP